VNSFTEMAPGASVFGMRDRVRCLSLQSPIITLSTKHSLVPAFEKSRIQSVSFGVCIRAAEAESQRWQAVKIVDPRLLGPSATGVWAYVNQKICAWAGSQKDCQCEARCVDRFRFGAYFVVAAAVLLVAIVARLSGVESR
jgi:hypothetical protein